MTRNATEVERRRALAQLNEAQRIARLGSWSLDTRTRVSIWSPELYRLYARDPARGPAPRREWLQYVHPDDRPALEVATDRASLGLTFDADVRIVRDDGAQRVLHMLGQPDPDDPALVVGTVQDVTERREVERALFDSRAELVDQRELLAEILDHAPIGMAVVDPATGRFERVNHAMCEMLGYTEDELLPRTWTELTFSDDVGDVIAGIDALTAGKLDVYRAEKRYVHRDGHTIWAEIRVSAIRDKESRPQHLVAQIADISARRRYEAELERLATQDPLTGLANHRLFHQRLHEAMATSIRHERPLSVVVLDLDHFKQINDRFGHIVGDQTLEAVAARLATVVRDGELLARVGGEEFAWILPDADLAGAYAAAERARHAVGDVPLPTVGPVTVSAGVGFRDSLTDSTALYERADAALYEAKRLGRNQTVRWEPVVG